jgi:hypothetical protein
VQLVVNNYNYNGVCTDTVMYSMTLTLTVALQSTGGSVKVSWDLARFRGLGDAQ